MAPPFFEELGRCAYDVLRSGYNIGQFGVRTRTIPKDGFDLKTAASHNFDTERMHASLSAMHSIKPYGLILKESWSTDNKLTTEFQLRDRFAKGLVLKALNTFQPQSRKQTAAFRAEYMNDMMALNFRVDNTVSPTVCSLGAVFGYEAYLLGYETGVDLKTNALSHSHIALGYDLGNLKLHSFVKNNKEFGGTIYHRLNKDFEVGTILGWTVGSATTRFGAGFRYYLGNGATLKAKINNVSEVAICYTQSIAKGLRFVSSIGFDIKNFQKGNHQLGFGIEYDQGCCCEEYP